MQSPECFLGDPVFLEDHVQTGGCIGSSLRGEERPGAAGVCRGEWGDGFVWPC